MDVAKKPSFKLLYFQLVIRLLILFCLSARTAISLGTLGPHAGSHLKTFIHCLATTKVDISYPSNETWWYDSQGVHVPVLRHPIAVGYAASTADVQALVKCAVKHGIKICPRSGGHSYEAFSSEDHHFVIDVSRIAYVKFNEFSSDGPRTASVGAGIRLGRLYYELGQRQATFPAGTCPTVGLAGQVAAGGYGFLTRMWGTAADNVLELEMVDYLGRVFVANERTNTDLFFALRGGGGGSYGVVVRMELKIYPYPKLTTAFNISWDQPIKASEFSRAWFKWAPWYTMPREISIQVDFQRLSHMQGMYIGEDGHEGLEKILEASGIFELGPEGSQHYQYYSSPDNLEARAWMDNDKVHYGNAHDYYVYNSPTSFVLKPLNLPPYPNPVHETWAQIQTDPRVNATHPYGAVGTTGTITNMEPMLIDHDYLKYSSQDFVKAFDDAAYEAIDEFLSHDGTNIQFMPSGGIIYSYSDDFNAFTNRRTFFLTQYFAPYYLLGTHSPSGLQGQKEIEHQLLIALEPYSNHRSYQGYADLFWTTDPKIYMPRYYGNIVKRLVQIKRTYDPKDFFNNAQSTPTSI